MRKAILIFAAAMAVVSCDGAPDEAAPPADDVSAALLDAATNEAFIRIQPTPDAARVIIALPPADAEGVSLRAIHSSGVRSGLGSNPVGLDRGYQDAGRVIAFRRVGAKVFIEQENWRYRASADNPLEKKAVLDSFARSLLWAGEVKHQGEDGSYTVDISGFLTSDTLDLRGWLKSAEQGDFNISAERSFVDPASILVFPDNIEIDAVMTLTSDKPGGEVTATAAEGRAATLTIHHSFVRLPPPGYQPRFDDPRVGAINIDFYDFSAPLDEPIIQRFARRFRLEREDPAATSGPVKKPIVFYVDRGAPERVRQALIEGGQWWAEAFEEAGFEDAFRVEVLPEGVHPFDVRYNVIQWTHRQTRGWSYGGGVADPRTGEMLKGHVILGSQRVRQDRMIFEGLAGAAKTGTGAVDDPVELALARIRQLSAHEIGHPLGFEHNFAASAVDRSSVMDYPAPLVRPDGEGGLDLSEAYGVGIGAWDKFTVKWLYSQFPPGTDEESALNDIVMQGYGAGLKFVEDAEGRSVGSAHPDGSVWDNGDDPVAMLDETMEVRRIALEDFGLRVIKPDRPVSELRAVIVPIYLYHRYQVAAASKLIGGVKFDYSLKGDDRGGERPVPPDRQRAALAAILRTLEPAALDLPDSVLRMLTPADQGFSSIVRHETFDSRTGPMFDALAAADAAASLSLGALLHPARLARVAETARRNPAALDLDEMLRAIEATIFTPARPRLRDISETVRTRYIDILVLRAADESIAAPVRAELDLYLRDLRGRIAPGLLEGGAPDRAHRLWLSERIERHLARPGAPADAPSASAAVPPGSPIGAQESCWHCDPIEG